MTPQPNLYGSDVHKIDHGSYYTVLVGKELIRCVVCGRPLEHSYVTNGHMHKCPPSVLRAKKSAATRANIEDDTESPGTDRASERYAKGYDNRLRRGFDLMRLDQGGKPC